MAGAFGAALDNFAGLQTGAASGRLGAFEGLTTAFQDVVSSLPFSVHGQSIAARLGHLSGAGEGLQAFMPSAIDMESITAHLMPPMPSAEAFNRLSSFGPANDLMNELAGSLSALDSVRALGAISLLDDAAITRVGMLGARYLPDTLEVQDLLTLTVPRVAEALQEARHPLPAQTHGGPTGDQLIALLQLIIVVVSLMCAIVLRPCRSPSSRGTP